jgi:ABC-type uncharacterized transport system auxiliary subunit
MKKKLASVLLCAVMAASMLTGCGNADNATATTLLPTIRRTQQQLPRRQRRPQRQQALYTI